MTAPPQPILDLDTARQEFPAALERGMAVALWAKLMPDTPAVIAPAGERTFAQLNARSNQIVRALRDRGLVAGDSIALMCSVYLKAPDAGRFTADVGVIGVPNLEWGEEVKAVATLHAGHAPTQALGNELIEYCRARLAHFKCPRSVDFVASLPRQDNGKLYKQKLREEYRAKHG